MLNLKVVLLFCVCFIAACRYDAHQDELNKSSNLNQAAMYNTQLGLAYLKQGNRPRAKKKLLQALSEAPNSPNVNAAMAYYLEQTKEFDKAKTYYLKAIVLSSNGGALCNNYGAFLCRRGDYQQAEQYFLKAAKDIQYLHASGAYENAGLCSLLIPDYKKARHYFKMSLNQDPSRRESLYELVKLESQMGHNTLALRQLKKYPNLVLKDTSFLFLAKKIAKQTGDTLLFAQYEDALSNNNNSGVSK